MTDTEKSRAMDLYNRLFDLLKKEEAEIRDNDLDKIERYCCLKMNILEELNNCRPFSGNIHESHDIVSVIKKIQDIHRSNTDAVEIIKNAVMEDISALNKGKTAFKAYSTGMHLRS